MVASLSPDISTVRAAVLSEAASWLGTPYRHQASCKGAGCDCLGLLRGVWRALYGAEAEPVPAYQPDWTASGTGESLVEAARRWLSEQAPDAAVPGDVLLFRWREHLPARHVAILSAPRLVIHAYERVGVVESPLVPAWRRRIAHVFSFPEQGQWQP
ncbi:NlpC/P60 family protein [Labrenzia sp. CE80]|uniref:NlpC/P60 family protein n=1 Tax=Labrenzia sp. CE80 TaxID=1788986 RepID=UPI00129B5E06|nr:NlpC/P60 family protein [Labrenzia sp. CE80]